MLVCLSVSLIFRNTFSLLLEMFLLDFEIYEK